MLFILLGVLVPCMHGWNLGAGVLDCRPPLLAAHFIKQAAGNTYGRADTGALCVDDSCLDALPGRWWLAEHTCMRCSHGFVGSSNLVFAGACFMRECVLEVVETTRRAAVADIELPLQSDPIRWPNEWRLPLGQVAPNCLPFLLTMRPPMYQAIAFHEQSGAFVHAWAAVGIHAASVADRPAALPPVAQSAHFVAGVRAFHEWSGQPIPFLTTHWDCAPAGYASKARWKTLMQSGELQQNVEDAVWCRSISRLFAGETTKSAMEFFLGPPTVKTNLACWAGDRLKDWWWFQAEGVPVLEPPLKSVPLTARSTHHDRDDCFWRS